MWFQEQEQMREMQAAREIEERAMRERQHQIALQREREAAYSRDYSNDQPAQVDRRYNGGTPDQYGGPGERFAPPPPERKSSYDVYSKASSTPNLANNTAGYDMAGGPNRSGSSSALKQAENAYNSKKSVSFNPQLTEIHDNRRFMSTSSETSTVQQTSTEYQTQRTSSSSSEQSLGFNRGGSDPSMPRSSSSDQNVGYSRGGNNGESSMPRSSSSDQNLGYGGRVGGSADPSMGFQRGYRQQPGGVAPGGPPQTPTTPTGGGDVFDMQTPENQYSSAQSTMVTGSTPGVVGAQEVYRDPRDRIAAQKASGHLRPPSNQLQAPGERMSFRDKMRMFAHEIGEGTPEERQKSSRAQQRIEING